MPDINQPDTIPSVERRLEGKGQGAGKQLAPEQQPKKVAENYAETARANPRDDRITILGIPVEQITPATQAALGGLVSEINFLRNAVKRMERLVEKRSPAQTAAASTPVLEPDAFFKALNAALAEPTEGSAWLVVLVHVPTYEDIRRSSGLLAANSALADVAHRLREAPIAGVPSALFTLLGYVGGSNLAGLVTLPAATEPTSVAHSVRNHLTSGGYNVSGIDMALAISTAAAVVGSGESATLALGRADHLLRTSG